MNTITSEFLNKVPNCKIDSSGKSRLFDVFKVFLNMFWQQLLTRKPANIRM